MFLTELDPSASKLLGVLTLTVLKHLGDNAVVVAEDDTLCPEWRMARIGDVALLEKPADDKSPKRIDCYQIVECGAVGAAFRLDPQCLVYSLRWLHNATPPDFELVLLQDNPEAWAGWINGANLILLTELRRRAPHVIDWDGMPDVIPVLDAFEEAVANKNARRH